MTHHEAIERSRRALDHRPDCHHELVQLEPDPNVPLLEPWLCGACRVLLLIDPTGVIRDTLPAQTMTLYAAREMEQKIQQVSPEQHAKFKALIDGMVADIEEES